MSRLGTPWRKQASRVLGRGLHWSFEAQRVVATIDSADTVQKPARCKVHLELAMRAKEGRSGKGDAMVEKRNSLATWLSLLYEITGGPAAQIRDYNIAFTCA